MFDEQGRVTMRDMLVDFAPYLFRGRMAGYLTRLSTTGLANVTSGGGQVPAFVVSNPSSARADVDDRSPPARARAGLHTSSSGAAIGTDLIQLDDVWPA